MYSTYFYIRMIHQFCGKKMVVFLKTNVMIIFLQFLGELFQKS
jgi:hypothetical protein